MGTLYIVCSSFATMHKIQITNSLCDQKSHYTIFRIFYFHFLKWELEEGIVMKYLCNPFFLILHWQQYGSTRKECYLRSRPDKRPTGLDGHLSTIALKLT